MRSLSIIVAYDRNYLIGDRNQLPWYLPADLKRFKALTTGNAIIMGRATHQSIGRPLPNRRNIILTRQAGWAADGCQIAHSLAEAAKLVAANEEPFVIGGSQIYQLALPYAHRLYVTEVAAKLRGDTYFPVFDKSQWRIEWQEAHGADKDNPYDYTFVNYVRI